MTRHNGYKILNKYRNGSRISKKEEKELGKLLQEEIKLKYRCLMHELNGHEGEDLYVAAKCVKLSVDESLASLIVVNEEMTRLVFRLFAPDFPSHNEDMPSSTMTNEVLARIVFHLTEPDSSSYKDNSLTPLDYNEFLMKKYGDYWYAKMSPKEKAGFFFVNSQINNIPETRLRASLQESMSIFYRIIKDEFEKRETLDDETLYFWGNLINCLLNRAVSTIKGLFSDNDSQTCIDETTESLINIYQELISISKEVPKTIEEAKSKLQRVEELTDKLVAKQMTSNMRHGFMPIKPVL